MEVQDKRSERQVVLAERLRNAHPVGQCLTAVLGAGSAGYFPVDGERSNVALGGIVVRRDIGAIQEGEHAVEVLIESGLEAGDIGMHCQFTVGDEATQADADTVTGGVDSRNSGPRR